MDSSMNRDGSTAAFGADFFVGMMIVGAFALFVTNFDLFLSVRGYLPINTLIVFVVFSAGFTGLILATSDHGRTLDRIVLGLRMNAGPVVILLLWIAAHVIAAGRIVLSGGDVDYAQILPVFQLAVLAVGMILASLDTDGRWIVLASHLAIFVLGASIIFETIFPGALGTSAARTGGFALNANIPGFIIPALLAVSLDFRRIRLADLAVILFSLVAVSATLSRMGLGFLGSVICTYALIFFLRGGATAGLRKILLGGLFLALSALLMIGSFSILSMSSSATNTEFSTRIKTILGGQSVLEDPYRGPLLDHFIEVASQKPWVGYGPGDTLMNAVTRAPLGLGPHNMFVRAWVDTGLAGLFLYAAFIASIVCLGIVRRSVSATMVGTLVAAYGLFSHNVIDNKAVLILLGIALGQSAFKCVER